MLYEEFQSPSSISLRLIVYKLMNHVIYEHRNVGMYQQKLVNCISIKFRNLRRLVLLLVDFRKEEKFILLNLKILPRLYIVENNYEPEPITNGTVPRNHVNS
jgi:hypothetical protein